MKGRGKWALAGVLACTGLLVLLVRVWQSDRCPVSMPSNYSLLFTSPNASSAELAVALKRGAPASIDVGTSTDWVFEGPGSVEDSVWPLWKHLRANGGNWRQIRSRSFTVLSDDGKRPRVVMIPFRLPNGDIDKTKHRVRINGDWQRPGLYEKALASLPQDWLTSTYRGRR